MGLAPPGGVRPHLDEALELMGRFAGGSGPPRRYLWTDAFAVCNFLALARTSGEGRHVESALQLIDHVHHTLGRHRGDAGRRGWISGLGPAEGEAHPTAGGLRIGKRLPERPPGAPPDERQEWDRDGQYFHYATKWMHALDQSARAVRRPVFSVWARELALAVHRGFTYVPPRGGRRRMHWKMSIDLSRPLVASMGQHDPLDGFLTCVELEATAAALGAPGPSVTAIAADFAAMIDPAALATADPLGIGGLLADAYRAVQLQGQDLLAGHEGLAGMLLDAALAGLRAWVAHGDLRLPARDRLAFRELGVVIGLAAVPLLARNGRPDAELHAALEPRLAALARFGPLGAELRQFWLRAEHRLTDAWRAHQDINDVMLATSIVPQGFLVLGLPGL
jgi:hypothetical protein